VKNEKVYLARQTQQNRALYVYHAQHLAVFQKISSNFLASLQLVALRHNNSVPDQQPRNVLQLRRPVSDIFESDYLPLHAQTGKLGPYAFF